MGKRTWTAEEEEKLEELYKTGMKLDDIAKELGKTHSGVNSKAHKLKLGDKYPRKNNANQHQVYHDYDWCYERYIVKGMTYTEMAEECGATPRVIQKWCSEKHRLNGHTFRKEKKINEKQYQLILGGLLGDGHITDGDRSHKAMYIECHAVDQKEYLYWKYGLLEDLCSHEPTYYESYVRIIDGEEHICKPFYRFNTRIVDELDVVGKMSKENILDKIDIFGIVVHILDDGTRGSSNWTICLADFTDQEEEKYRAICEEKFGLIGHVLNNDRRYFMFDAPSSRKIDALILSMVPNEIDIVQHKIINNEICKPANYKYIETNDGRVGLARYCKINHINYVKVKPWFDELGRDCVSEEEFAQLRKKYA